MLREHVPRLRIVIGALVLTALLVQFVAVPWTASSYAEAYPEVAYLATPYVIAIMVAIGGFEFALLAAWQLLSVAVTGGGSTSRSKRWANMMTASLVFAAVIVAGVFAHAGSVASVGGPAMLFGLLASFVLILAALALRRKTMSFSMGNDVDDPVSRYSHTT